MWYPIRLIVTALLAGAAAAAGPVFAADGLAGAHALSMFGDVKYGPDFEHFDYADPDAPAGGGIRLAALGTFDSLNPFILKGNPAAGSGLIYDNLLTAPWTSRSPSTDCWSNPSTCRRIGRGSSSRCARRRAGTTAVR